MHSSYNYNKYFWGKSSVLGTGDKAVNEIDTVHFPRAYTIMGSDGATNQSID